MKSLILLAVLIAQPQEDRVERLENEVRQLKDVIGRLALAIEGKQPRQGRWYGGVVTADNPEGLRTSIPLAKVNRKQDPQSGLMVVEKSTSYIQNVGGEKFRRRTYDAVENVHFPQDTLHGNASSGAGSVGGGGGAARRSDGPPRQMEMFNGGQRGGFAFPTDQYGNAGPFNVPTYGSAKWKAWQRFRLEHSGEYPNDLALNLAWLKQS